MELLSAKEQLANLDEAWRLLAQANTILCVAGMGGFRYDEHPGRSCQLTYAIQDLRAKTVEALNSINYARLAIANCIQSKTAEPPER